MVDPLQLLNELVALDSTSTRSNLPVIDLLERRVSALGFDCQRLRYVDDAGVEKANLVARSGEGLPELALVGHTDCVPFDDGWKDALTLTERDGQLYGRGACDTKSFIAAAVTAAARARAKLTRPFQLVFTADEELGCVGARKLAEAGVGRCRRAIIGEPTSLTPVRANKGYCLGEVVVEGKEGHSAYPDQGASAVFRAARLLTRLEAFALGELRLTRDPAFEPPYATVNVGLLRGGKAKNVIPGECRFTVEWRPLPGQDLREVPQVLERLIAEATAEDKGFRASFTVKRTDAGFDTKASEDVVATLATLSGRAARTVSFGTEGPQLEQLGARCVVFGPGDIGVAHQTGEHVPKAELLRAAELLEAAVLHFCG